MGGHHVKWSKPGSERQWTNVLSDMSNTDLKQTYTQKQTSYTHLHVEHVYNNGTILWNLGVGERKG
jgi:hypothetical protein